MNLRDIRTSNETEIIVERRTPGIREDSHEIIHNTMTIEVVHSENDTLYKDCLDHYGLTYTGFIISNLGKTVSSCDYCVLDLTYGDRLQEPETTYRYTFLFKSFIWAEETIRNHYQSIANNKSIDFKLSYKSIWADGVALKDLFQYKGYTGRFFADDRITLLDMFEFYRNTIKIDHLNRNSIFKYTIQSVCYRFECDSAFINYANGQKCPTYGGMYDEDLRQKKYKIVYTPLLEDLENERLLGIISGMENVDSEERGITATCLQPEKLSPSYRHLSRSRPPIIVGENYLVEYLYISGNRVYLIFRDSGKYSYDINLFGLSYNNEDCKNDNVDVIHELMTEEKWTFWKNFRLFSPKVLVQIVKTPKNIISFKDTPRVIHII